ncbi:MAG: FAD-binding and (Fe-S)-binding domain-containing protein, partial [bacterium]
MAKTWKEKIKKAVAEENFIDHELDLLCYSRDMSVHRGIPDAVVFTTTTEEVSRLLRAANSEKVPVTVRGSGTSVTGAIVPVKKGIILDLTKMDKIKDIRKEDGYAIVEPGVICQNLNAALSPTHFFPPDPGSSNVCTLGGMVATNASGTRAVRYGTTRDWVMGVEVVLADGKVARTGSRVPKTSSGYDLTRLFANSEGTLGVITEITLGIIPLPEYIAFASASFERLEDAGRTVSELFSSGVCLSACEILDSVSIGVVNKAMKLGLREAEGMLFVEVDGKELAVRQEVAAIEAVFRRNNGTDIAWSDDPEERQKLWAARGGLVPSLSRFKKGYRLIPIAEDFGVPVSKVPDAIRGAQKISKKYGLVVATFGHAGDGNVHTTFIMDVRKKREWNKVKKMAEELIDLAMSLGGTVTAEHGLGVAKAPFAGRELSSTIPVMRKIKKALDPNSILNPGKLSLGRKDAKILDYFAFSDIAGKELETFSDRIDDEILVCVLCGFCRMGCPTFESTVLESRNARGRIILAQSLLTDSIKPSPELADRIYSCTICSGCTAACPASIEIPEIVLACRKRLAEADCMPESHVAMVENIEKEGNPFGSPRKERTDLYPREHELITPEKAEVLLFLGCLPSYADMEIVPATFRIMHAAGADFTVLGQDEDCCGYVHHLVGSKDFEKRVRANMKKFGEVEPRMIVTPCAGCYKTLKTMYPKDFMVFHISQYLHGLLEEGKLTLRKSFDRKVVYHDPCDLGRHMQVYDEPREILKAIPGLELVEFEKNRSGAVCCGGGGGLMAYDREMSLDISRRRVENALQSGADTLVSACA